MTPDLIRAVLKLRDVQARFARNEIAPVPHRDEREAALADALRAMAAENAVRLQEPVQVNSNGEFSIVAQHSEGPMLTRGCGQFGVTFAQALTVHGARTGTPGPNTILAEAGWCYLNHFAAERMVNAYYDKRMALALTIASLHERED